MRYTRLTKRNTETSTRRRTHLGKKKRKTSERGEGWGERSTVRGKECACVERGGERREANKNSCRQETVKCTETPELTRRNKYTAITFKLRGANG